MIGNRLCVPCFLLIFCCLQKAPVCAPKLYAEPAVGARLARPAAEESAKTQAAIRKTAAGATSRAQTLLLAVEVCEGIFAHLGPDTMLGRPAMHGIWRGH